MNTRLKYFGVIIVAQIGCVATGVWLQHRYVMATVSHGAELSAWKRLDRSADTLIASLLGHGKDASDLASESLESMRERIAATAPVDAYPQVLVDATWRVVACNATRGTHTDCPPVGETLAWQKNAGERQNVSGGESGRLMMQGDDNIALALPVDRGAGHLLILRPAELIRRDATAMTGSLPIAGFLAAVWTCTLLGIMVYIIVARLQDRFESERSDSEAKSLKHIQTLVRTRDAVIFGLAKLADCRDPETGDHLERIAIYASTLASAMRGYPKYADAVTGNFVRLIGISSALHDIGKVGLEDSILLKPGPLTTEERRRMQIHTTNGGECLRQIEYRLGQSNFLQMAREIALAHHERWDGTGYPNGIAAEDIPLAARIVSIVDVYDALSSRRVYKDPMPHGQCVDIIREGAGTQFDPAIIEIWLRISDQFRDLAKRYSPSAVSADQAPTVQLVTCEQDMAATTQ